MFGARRGRIRPRSSRAHRPRAAALWSAHHKRVGRSGSTYTQTTPQKPAAVLASQIGRLQRVVSNPCRAAVPARVVELIGVFCIGKGAIQDLDDLRRPELPRVILDLGSAVVRNDLIAVDAEHCHQLARHCLAYRSFAIQSGIFKLDHADALARYSPLSNPQSVAIVANHAMLITGRRGRWQVQRIVDCQIHGRHVSPPCNYLLLNKSYGDRCRPVPQSPLSSSIAARPPSRSPCITGFSWGSDCAINTAV
jgi:hypothetical protein